MRVGQECAEIHLNQQINLTLLGYNGPTLSTKRIAHVLGFSTAAQSKYCALFHKKKLSKTLGTCILLKFGMWNGEGSEH